MNISNLINNDKGFSFQQFNSLKSFMGEKKISLSFLTYVIKSTLSNPIKDLADLARRIQEYQNTIEQSEKERAKLRKWSIFLNKMILNQFPKAECASIAEAIANACDAKKFKKVNIEARNQEIRILDEGKGISYQSHLGSSTLAQLLISGFSSKQDEKIGHYGQGILSIFLYALHEQLAQYNPIPSFSYNADNKLTLVLQGENREQEKNEIHFIFNDETIEQTFSAVDKTIKERVTFLSSASLETALQLDVYNEQGELLVDLTDTKKNEKGTSLIIQSLLVNKIYQKIQQFIFHKFKFFERNPIYWNNVHINSFEGLSRINFQGGTFYFDNLKNCVTDSKLNVCESGVFILDKPIENCVAPGSVAINFDAQTATSERATIDFKDQKVVQSIINLIDQILSDKEKILQEKAVLFNALHPLVILLKKEGIDQPLNLIKEFAKSCKGFPDKNEIRNLALENAIYFHSDYIDALFVPMIFEQAEVVLLSVQGNSPSPFAYFQMGTQYVILINTNYFNMNHPLVCQFNFEWMKEIYEQITEKKLPLNVLQAVSELFPKEKKEKFPDVFLPEDEESDSEDGDNSMADCEALMIIFSKDYSPFAKKIIRKCYEVDTKDELEVHKDLLVKVLKSLTKIESSKSIPKNFPNLEKEFVLFIHKFFQIDDLPRLGVNVVLKTIFNYLNSCEYVDQKNYLDFLSATVESKSYFYTFFTDNNFNFDQVQENFYKLNALVKTYGKADPRLVKFFLQHPPAPEELQNCHLLLEKASQQCRFILFPVISLLENHSKLLNLSDDQLSSFFEILPYKLMLKNEVAFKDQDYPLIFKYISSNAGVSQQVKMGWLQLYYLLRVIGTESDINFNFEEFCKILPVVPFLKNVSPEGYERNIKDLLESFDKLRDFFKYFFILQKILQVQMKQNTNFINLSKAEQLLWAKNIIQSMLGDEYFKKIQNLDGLIEEILETILLIGTDATFANYFTALKKRNLIFSNAKELLFAALTPKDFSIKTLEFTFPKTIDKPAELLHTIPFVMKWCGSEEIAQNVIKTAMKQNSDEFFFLLELIKNCIEARSTIVRMDIFVFDGCIVFYLSDNGIGMDKKSFKAFFNPNDSTKNDPDEVSEIEKPSNFGRGAFASFGHFDEILVYSHRVGNPMQKALLKRTEDNLMLERDHEAILSNDFTGSVFFMRKKVDDITQYYIKLKAAIFDLKNIVGVDLFFNDLSINGVSYSKIETSEPYRVGKNKLLLTAQLNSGDSGIYIRQMKMGDIPETYKALPKVLEEFIKKNGMKLSLFIPEAGQVMNRNFFTHENSLILPCKLAILKTTVKYALNNLLEVKSGWKKLSDDILFDFRILNEGPTETQRLIIDFFKDKQIHFNNDDFKKEMVLELAKKSLSSFSFDYPPYKNLTIDELADYIFENDQNMQKEKQLAYILEFFKEEDHCISVLMYLPLSESGVSIIDIRNRIQQQLLKKGILSYIDKGYNLDFIRDKKNEFLKEELHQAFETISKELNIPAYNSILDKFQGRISKKIESIQIQMRKKIKTNVEYEKFGRDFLSTIAKKFLELEITVDFESIPNASEAFIRVHTNKVTINKLGYHYEDFQNFYDEYQNSNDPYQAIFNHLSTCKNILKTLVHECEHIIEGTGHYATHTPRFKKEMADLRKKLIISNEQDSFIEIIQQLLSKREFEEPPLKRAKTQPGSVSFLLN